MLVGVFSRLVQRFAVMGDLKGAPAVHLNFPLQSLSLNTTFKSGIAAADEPILLNRGDLMNDTLWLTYFYGGGGGGPPPPDGPCVPGGPPCEQSGGPGQGSLGAPCRGAGGPGRAP